MYMKWCSVALPESGSRCVVGMSGGVDSSLVTKLLLEKGCHVIGVTMSTWANDMPLPPNDLFHIYSLLFLIAILPFPQNF